jgi:dTDP-4-amino-4,6-dideoxygalactose transaminase
MRIPFNRATLTGPEYRYIGQAIDHGHISGDGEYTARCSRLLEAEVHVSSALLTTSCTHALEMAAILLNLKEGDEVIVPSFTFVSTVNAFVLRGAVPIFCDIRPDTLNIDETKIEGLITGRTRAIFVVHYAGVGCEMDEITKIGIQHNIPIVEDNAHGLFGQYKGKSLGSFGCLATLSFHETKNFTCGEGGALLVNDITLFERAEIIREKGTNRSRFFRGQVDKYSWVDIGSSYLPSDMLAAFLFAQLEARLSIQARRREIWMRYASSLQSWASEQTVRMPVVPAHCEQSWHMFYLLLPSLSHRQALIKHLKGRDILSAFHYLPLHLSDMGQRFNGRPGDCPVTEDVSDRLLRLPFYNALTLEEQDYVIEAVMSFC